MEFSDRLLVGGISDGIISNCYSTGFVGGDDYVGGLVASNFGGGISNCYSRGSVNGDDYVGGLVGSNYDGGAITNCYSTGSVSGGEYFVGGLVGRDENYNYDAIGSSFWDVNTSGWTTSAGGLGRTTAQMQDINTFLEAGWDFVAETANGTCGFWLMPDSGGYPLLAGLLEDYVPPEPSGSGTETEPYIVSDANGLGTVWYRPSAHYLLVNDIDLAGIDWSGAIVPFFGGVFDGNDRIISHMDINTPSSKYAGLFGYVDATGQIKNLGVEDISIVGRDFLGGLVGYNCGVVSNCYSTGSVNGEYDVGALLGWNFGAISNCYSTGSVSGGEYNVGGLVGHTWGYSAVISNCYSTGSVTGRWRLVGGLVGGNDYGAITNCYATGSVSGYQFVGGLIGSNGNDATISKSYSTGSASGEYDVGGLVGKNESGAINSSFWDVNTSGWPTSAGGTPKTTAEMKTESTFISAGWDFVGESANGTEDIWSICEGTNYPRLVWQIPAADWLCPDGVGLEDFGYFGGYWRTDEGGAVNLDGEDGIGFGDLMIFCEQWLRGR